MTFNDLKLIPQILKAVDEIGYTEPSEIQTHAIPLVLEGHDLIGCAQTGTGKTAAFAIPILQKLSENLDGGKRHIKVLILTPTRELALQIKDNFDLYGKYLPVRNTVIFGGVGQNPQVAALRRGVDVLVATPGRLNDLCNQGHIDLSHVECFVLDEADRMMDMGFIHDVRKVIGLMPKKRQTLLFSATMPGDIEKLARQILVTPKKVEVTPVSTAAPAIEQKIYRVDKVNKRLLLEHILDDRKLDSVLVFTRTKHGADRVQKELDKAHIKSLAIHGNKSQNARVAALDSFKKGEIRVLVATDIAARGIDISELTCVINYDLPNMPETYVHRIGRTGRAGCTGVAISFCDFDELEYLRDIEKVIGERVPEVTEHPYPMAFFQKAPTKERQPRQKVTALNSHGQPKTDNRRPEGKHKTHYSSKGKRTDSGNRSSK